MTEVKANVTDWLAKLVIKDFDTKPWPGREPKANLAKLYDHYWNCIATCHDAIKTCNELLNSPALSLQSKWREVIKENWPEFPDDLIECLQPKVKWPPWLRDKIGNEKLKQWDNKPEMIALEWAARKGDAEDFAYTPSSLKKRLAQQNPKKKK